MTKSAHEMERTLDDLSPGTRETIIIAAHKDDLIWNDTMEAHSVDVASSAGLRRYILQTYTAEGDRVGGQ